MDMPLIGLRRMLNGLVVLTLGTMLGFQWSTLLANNQLNDWLSSLELVNSSDTHNAATAVDCNPGGAGSHGRVFETERRMNITERNDGLQFIMFVGLEGTGTAGFVFQQSIECCKCTCFHKAKFHNEYCSLL